MNGSGHQGYSLVSPCSLSAGFHLKSFDSQPAEASLAAASPVRCFNGPLLGRRSGESERRGWGDFGKSIDFVYGSDSTVACRSRVMAEFIEYMLPLGEIGVIGEVGPRPPRAAIPSVADCDRGLWGGRSGWSREAERT